MLVAIFDTQQFCSSDGGSIPSDFFSKELKTTQITQATLTLYQLWTLICIYIDAKNVNIAVSKSSRIRKVRVPILMSGAISGHKPGNTRGANSKRPIRRILGSASKNCALLPRRKSKLTLQLGISEG